MRFLFALIWALSAAMGYAQVQDVVSGSYTPGFYSVQNFIKNPNCFTGTRYITASGTGAIARNTTSPLAGIADCSISGTASGDKITFSGRTFDKALKGQNCELRFTYAGDASKWKAYAAISGTAVSQAFQLESTIDGSSVTQSKTASVLYPCGDASSPVDIVFEATASTPLTFKTTKFQSGLATNMASVAQARFFASKRIQAGGAGCDFTSNSSSFSSPAAISGCNTPTNAGYTTDTAKDPHIRLSSYPAGRYYIVATGAFYNGATGNQLYTRITDGAKFGAQQSVYSSTGTLTNSSIIGQWDNASSQSSATISIQILSSNNTSTVGIYTAGIGADYEISVYYYPAASQIVQAPDQRNTDPASCSFSSLAWQGLGTVTSNLMCRKSGRNLIMNGKVTVGTVAAAIAQIPLPTWGGVQLLTANSSIVPNPISGGRILRILANSSVPKDYNTIITAGTNNLGVSYPELSSGITPLSAQNGSALFNNTEILSFEDVTVPIEGWTETAFINGSLTDEVTSSGSGFGADIQMVYFGSGANCTTACSTGACSICRQMGTKITSVTFVSTAVYDINGIDGTKYTCGGVTFAGGNYGAVLQDLATSTSTKARVFTGSGTSGGAPSYGTVTCFGKP